MGQRPFIVVGDQTDHGGVVVEGSSVTDTHGKRIARVGDQVTCPKRGHGTTVIITGDQTMIIDGRPAARQGDKCACGATLIASQAVSTTSDGGASNPQAASDSQKAKAASAGVFSKYLEPTPQGFDQRFLINDTSGQPMKGVPYRISLKSGVSLDGRTDSSGLTQPLAADSAEMALLEVLQEEPALRSGWDA